MIKNRFDESYDIRLAEYEEIPELMQFIDDYWKKGHILAVNREFFLYEMVIDSKVNFLIAKNRSNGNIEGIIGFLPASSDKNHLDIWGVIWKTSPDAKPMLGIELMKRLPEVTGARTLMGVGANSRTAVPLLKRILHYYSNKMQHYYRLKDTDEYKIAKINDRIIPEYAEAGNLSVLEIKDKDTLHNFIDFDSFKNDIPYKDEWYYCRRFIDHPVYSYNLWGFKDNDSKALMVTRKQEYQGSSIIRIVDYVGDQSLFGRCGSFFDELLEDNEYIDFYFDGFNSDIVEAAGMVNIDDYDNIIPDYFHPFEQSNVDIYVVSSNNNGKCMFFKGDGDQDRPN